MKTVIRLISAIVLFVSFGNAVTPVSAGFWDDVKNVFSPSGGGSSSTRVTKNDLLVSGGDNSAYSDTNANFRDNFLTIIGKYVIGLLGIVSVSVFLYLGYTLVTASGKEEDFKKAWKWLTYAAVGLAIIPLAYVVVKIVTGFTL